MSSISKIATAVVVLLILGTGLSTLILDGRTSFFGSPNPARHASPGRISDSPPSPDDAGRRKSLRPPKLSSTITPDEARRKMDSARAIANINQRAKACQDIIAALCESGYVKEAWEMMETNPGKVRDMEIYAFFRSARLTFDELSHKMDGLLYDGESMRALAGYLSSKNLGEMNALIEEDSKALEQLPGMQSNDLKNAVTGFLLNKLAGSDRTKNDPVTIVQAAIDFHKNRSLDDYGLAMVLKIDPTRDEFQKYKALSAALEKSGSGVQASGIRKEIIENMIYQNADRAMESVLSSQGPKSLDDLTTAFTKYQMLEPARANKWFDARRLKLSPQQQDAVSIIFFKAAIRDAGKTDAAIWMNQVQDPMLKEWAAETMEKELANKSNPSEKADSR